MSICTKLFFTVSRKKYQRPLLKFETSQKNYTLNPIKEAHTKVKSGADFQKYIQELSQLGVVGYSTYVSDGHTKFVGTDNYALNSEARYALMPIADESKLEQFQHYLKIHQQGQTDYLIFCQQAANTGADKWIVDVINMTCTYYDKKEVLVETIPSV